ncbi:MAG: class I SAM-dependent methyltransferase [Dokdonia sp.]|jgi:ubiquinone/menaquinone biosynthesis C-methylase UbiE
MTTLLYVALLLLIVANIFLLYRVLYKGKTKTTASYNAKDVGEFYNKQTDNFLKVYGEVIQAFRTTDVSKLLAYQMEAIGFQKGQRVLDAGCGVCGPARYFAKHAEVTVEAITISQDQVDKSKQYIRQAGLEGSVNVQQGDYHHLSDYYDSDSFDTIYFLESFGHAVNHEQVLGEAWGMLKPGGTLYIKDLFIKEAAIPSLEDDILREVQNINKAYRYNVADLYQILRFARKKGFIVSKLKTIDIPLEDFENLTISNDFQELTGINKIENLQEYVFPVDFFELTFTKPWNALEYGNSRYFLQNLFYMQVHNRKQEEL